MCGRFDLHSLSTVLESYFNAQPPGFEFSANYNVAPTQEIPVIIQRDGTRQFTKRHWGLVPFWAKDISMGARMINARVETLAYVCRLHLGETEALGPQGLPDFLFTDRKPKVKWDSGWKLYE